MLNEAIQVNYNLRVKIRRLEDDLAAVPRGQEMTAARNFLQGEVARWKEVRNEAKWAIHTRITRVHMHETAKLITLQAKRLESEAQSNWTEYHLLNREIGLVTLNIARLEHEHENIDS